MSVKVMAHVWDLELKPTIKFVLLAYTDHADHEGKNIFPAVQTVANKTGYSKRTVQAATRELEETGHLLPSGIHNKYQTNVWRYGWVGGAGDSPPAYGGTEGVQTTHERGAGDSPEPLINHHKNINHHVEEETAENVFKTYEQEIGPLTPMIGEKLTDLEKEHTTHWVCESLKECSMRGKRSLGYAESILKRWKVDGYGTPPPRERTTTPSEPAGFAAIREYREMRGVE